ncbi:protein artichoke-like [Maniola jurtina]|uniref:protein artichoke-like n=1 Tax=Maniola jurtina TaxID=191418 RepID=UPI001E68A44B|nr:protein artichoke-like [Maniola jurtina]XP_045777405.1 protein artichoke-like [Maniola jurtina]XP_045777406.1 protein artichoke-like [Maniola jurtina]XP_045777407.1 protein artichoke-like [Maniola jurtina]
MLLLSFLILVTILGVDGQCSLEQLPEHVCSAKISCNGTTGNMMNIVKDLKCRKTGRRYNSYYNRYDNDLHNNYNLYVNLRDIDTFTSEDPFIGMTDVSNNVINLNIENGNRFSVPIIVGSLVKLTEFSMTYNKVEVINFRTITAGGSMKYLNVSHNCISTIEEDLVKSTVPILITTIDLSYNELESLSDNCFARFTELQYLDLSFNLLKQIDILTFEGITQLETLRFSNNKLSEIGQAFARFRNLKELSLDHNQLSSLTELNFRTLVSLEKLNLSSNLIKHIEDRSLSSSTNLKQLDLSHNKINVIRRTLFGNNTNLYKLSLSCNDIEHIEGGAFRTTNISYFDVQNNHISGSIDYDTFLGISGESLDLSNGQLTVLGDKAFSSLSSHLKYLNISNNSIENITESAFQSLQKLSKLDLSFNNLIDIDFNTSDLIELTEYYLQSNNIKKITPNMFRNMTSLVKLDMSQNKIVDVDLNSFTELINLNALDISSNNFVNSITANLFRGLYKVKSLDLSNTRLISCLNQSFSGMISLKYLNISHGHLETIEYDTFKATGAIKIIDLSYNNLEIFHVNTSSILQLSELYLNYNKLNNVTSKTFQNLLLLEKLNLASNNILYIDSSGFQTLSHLRYLNLFTNLNLRIKSDIFSNLILSEVSLRNIKQPISFKNALNTSITTLILSHCEVEDINSVFVYNINNILKLDISSNKIKALDKGSFPNMADLNWLDISFNIISSIQPGTFLSNKMINTLNLYGNHLQSLQFGVLDGLKNLRVLNLSNNEIYAFGVNLLHTTPHLTDLFLENNNLASINFKELSRTKVRLLTIGGNRISCDTLVDWKKLNADSNLNVTAENFDFNSENIYGIRCKTSSSREKSLNESTNIHTISEVTEIKEKVGLLYSYLKTITFNETFSKVAAFLEKNLENSDKVSANLSHSQLVLTDQLKDWLNQSKNLLPQLVSKSDNLANEIKLMLSLMEINNNLTKLSNTDKELLHTLVLNRTIQDEENLINIVPKLHDAKPLEVKLDKSPEADIKVVLYFIAVCLAILVLFRAVAITYKYLYRHPSHRIRKNNLCDSGQSVRNDLEME